MQWWNCYYYFLHAMQMKESKYAKVKGNLCKVKVDMDNYWFYLLERVQNFKSTEPDFSSLFHSSGASIGPRDGDPDGFTCFSCHSNLEHCSGLGLKANRSFFLLIWNLISSAPTSMSALVVLRKGLPSMRVSSCLPICQAPQNPLERRSFLFLPEYFWWFL